MDNAFWITAEILWTACGVVTIGASVVAHRSAKARYVGRIGVGVLFVIGGALLHVINLATGGDYTTFADPAHFDWVTNTWRDVVGPNQVLFIGLLIVFEAAVGVLALSGGRKTQLGYAGVIAFYLALWLFGAIETIWVIVMIPPMLLLLRAERRATAAPPPAATVEQEPRVHVGS